MIKRTNDIECTAEDEYEFTCPNCKVEFKKTCMFFGKPKCECGRWNIFITAELDTGDKYCRILIDGKLINAHINRESIKPTGIKPVKSSGKEPITINIVMDFHPDELFNIEKFEMVIDTESHIVTAYSATLASYYSRVIDGHDCFVGEVLCTRIQKDDYLVTIKQDDKQ